MREQRKRFCRRAREFLSRMCTKEKERAYAWREEEEDEEEGRGRKRKNSLHHAREKMTLAEKRRVVRRRWRGRGRREREEKVGCGGGENFLHRV